MTQVEIGRGQERPPGLCTGRDRHRAVPPDQATRKRCRSRGRSTPTGSTCRSSSRPMDSVVSPRTAVAIGRLGGLAVLDLEGLWTRYDDPEPLLAEAAELDDEAATRRLQEIYTEPIREELIGRRIAEVRAAGVTAAARLSPSGQLRYYKAVIDAGADIFVIRGTTVSAEHVSGQSEPLNLKQFIYELDVPVIVGGCATYTAALHLMRTGAAGVLSDSAAAPVTPRRRCSASRCRWPPRSPTSPPPGATTWTSPAAGTCT